MKNFFRLLGLGLSLFGLSAGAVTVSAEKNINKDIEIQTDSFFFKSDLPNGLLANPPELQEEDLQDAEPPVVLPNATSNLDEETLDPVVITPLPNTINNGRTAITEQKEGGVIKEIQVQTPHTRYVLRPPLIGNLNDKTLQPAMWEIGRFNESERKNNNPIAAPPTILSKP